MTNYLRILCGLHAFGMDVLCQGERLGISMDSSVRAGVRLKRMGLIEESESGVHLTKSGIDFINALPPETLRDAGTLKVKATS